MPQRSAQLVFCDLSTPKAGVFNVYDDMKAKLIERGIPKQKLPSSMKRTPMPARRNFSEKFAAVQFAC